MLLCIACGTVIFGFYALKGCDPYKAGYITNINQVCVSFIVGGFFSLSNLGLSK